MDKNVTIWLKRITIFCLPFIILLILYGYLDPFKVIKKYQTFYISDAISGVVLNRDYVSTSTFDNNYLSCKYNSFIFGNSRSIFYEVSDWKHYISETSNCFHFDASGESLYGIYRKIKYLDEKDVSINDVLVIFDYSTLTQIDSKQTHINVISPQLENFQNFISFHFCFIRAFFTPKFMIAYFDYKISGKVKKYMIKNSLLDDRLRHYELETNEISFPLFEELIEKGEYYTPERRGIFYRRDSLQSFEPLTIREKQKKLLTEIRDVFIKNKTNFKIIINPLYDQKKLNEDDFLYIVSLFGKERVFDFSGINEFTNDYSNFYEASHYRPHIAREILRRLYFYNHTNNAQYIN
jgi:hypothetical protein